MKKSNTVFLTTIFPAAELFLDDFFKSLNNQTNKDFDIFVLNDGVSSFEFYQNKYVDLNIIEQKSSLSPSKNREVAIKKVIALGYEFIIFGDSDDYFDVNRIEICCEKLQNYDIVVNDLTLIREGVILKKEYISKRISNNTTLNLEYILDKNLFGLSNTAIKASIVGLVDFEENLIAVDWFLFSTFLVENKTAVFTNETQTYYRQYEENTVGLGENSIEAIKKAILIKKRHYQSMVKKEAKYKILLKEIINLENKLHTFVFDSNSEVDTNLLWWENTKLIN